MRCRRVTDTPSTLLKHNSPAPFNSEGPRDTALKEGLQDCSWGCLLLTSSVSYMRRGALFVTYYYYIIIHHRWLVTQQGPSE